MFGSSASFGSSFPSFLCGTSGVGEVDGEVDIADLSSDILWDFRSSKISLDPIFNDRLSPDSIDLGADSVDFTSDSVDFSGVDVLWDSSLEGIGAKVIGSSTRDAISFNLSAFCGSFTGLIAIARLEVDIFGPSGCGGRSSGT